jgi:hypothetical protein
MGIQARDSLVLRRAFSEFATVVRDRRVPEEDVNTFLLEMAGTWNQPSPSDDASLLAQRLDLQTLLTYPPKPIEWLVSGLLASGEVVNLAAKWGVGKTWFALDLALTIADAERTTFLDRKVTHGRVIFLDEEGSEDLVRERLALLGGKSHAAKNIYYLLHTGTRLTDPSCLASLYEAVKETGPKLVVFDSLTRFYTKLDENKANDMAELTAAILPLSRKYGASVLLVDHGTKAGSRDPGDAARGSGEKAAGVDRVWTLEGGDGGLTLKHGKTRRGKAPPPIALQRRSSAEADSFYETGK